MISFFYCPLLWVLIVFCMPGCTVFAGLQEASDVFLGQQQDGADSVTFDVLKEGGKPMVCARPPKEAFHVFPLPELNNWTVFSKNLLTADVVRDFLSKQLLQTWGQEKSDVVTQYIQPGCYDLASFRPMALDIKISQTQENPTLFLSDLSVCKTGECFSPSKPFVARVLRDKFDLEALKKSGLTKEDPLYDALQRAIHVKCRTFDALRHAWAPFVSASVGDACHSGLLYTDSTSGGVLLDSPEACIWTASDQDLNMGYPIFLYYPSRMMRCSDEVFWEHFLRLRDEKMQILEVLQKMHTNAQELMFDHDELGSCKPESILLSSNEVVIAPQNASGDSTKIVAFFVQENSPEEEVVRYKKLASEHGLPLVKITDKNDKRYLWASSFR